jgi:hypothetical protein
MDDAAPSKFLEDLKAYFPQIHDLYIYGRQDPKVWSVVYALVDMWKETQYGDVTVTYQAGKIQHAFKRSSLTAESRKKLTNEET